MSFVLDNSVALAWCFADEQTKAGMALLDRVVEDGAHAPQIWPVEALNGLLSAERRGRITLAQRSALFAFLRDLPVAIDAGTADRAWRETAHLAAAHGLTAYDATYLELALRLALPLATALRSSLGPTNLPKSGRSTWSEFQEKRAARPLPLPARSYFLVSCAQTVAGSVAHLVRRMYSPGISQIWRPSRLFPSLDSSHESSRAFHVPAARLPLPKRRQSFEI